MDYQSISDPAQLQMLQELLRMVLYGVLLSTGVAAVCLFGLCISELRLPRHRPSDGKGHEGRTSGNALSEVARAEPGSFVIQHSPTARGLALRSDIR